jgi:hypothetical protein
MRLRQNLNNLQHIAKKIKKGKFELKKEKEGSKSGESSKEMEDDEREY